MSLTSRTTKPSGPIEEPVLPNTPGCPAYSRVPAALRLMSWGLPSPENFQVRSSLGLDVLDTSTIDPGTRLGPYEI